MGVLPSLRQKKRYIVFEVMAQSGSSSGLSLSFTDVQKDVQQGLLSFLGEWGVAQAAPQLLPESWSAEKQRFILRANHDMTDQVKSAIILIKSIKKGPVILRSITTSGTLKKARGSLR